MLQMPLPPSPGAQEHCSIDLVNSEIQLPSNKSFDALATPESTTQWLIERNLVPHEASLQAYCQNRLATLRAQIREAFTASTSGTEIGREALRGINGAAAGGTQHCSAQAGERQRIFPCPRAPSDATHRARARGFGRRRCLAAQRR
ncbi:ABATE domain-containing protein [Glutamicibacter halophytocola]|uniref:ABATE domain-containing protein n=1 Tax=Glutamicibacter halophytocola TaxID=1933880 RepID=UPI003D2E86C7